MVLNVLPFTYSRKSTYSLHNIFDPFIQSFIDNNIGIATNFLSAELANNLREKLIAHSLQDKMKFAGTGNHAIVTQDKLFRSDKIYWLDRAHNDTTENAFFDLMDEFILYLNSSCYTGITGYEFHYTLYEIGSFYKKHLDQFKNNDRRKYSMILYLNEAWKAEDGGELCIYTVDGHQHIAPENGKSVFFQSNKLAHEVLITQKARMSITGWLKVD